MKENIDRCQELIGLSEAGYSNNPKDKGGPTNHGITLKTLSAWRKVSVTIDDVKNLTVAEAREIIAAEYAAPIRFDDLPGGLDYCALDFSVNSGPDRPARELQKLIGMPPAQVDGIIGAKTLAALDAHLSAGVQPLIEKYCAARLAFMQSLDDWSEFGDGWKVRVARVQVQADAMAVGGIVVAPVIADAAISNAAKAKAAGAVKVTSTTSGKAALINVITAAGAVIVTAGSAASQASGVLQPYADISFVRYALLGLAVVSAAGTLVVAMRHAKAGATT